MLNMNSMDIGQVIIEIEDHAVPRLKLDVGEARLYYHLLRHSRFVGKHDVLISVAQLAEVLNCSKNTVKPRLRTLQEKKVIDVTNTGWAGTRIKVFLPKEIQDVVPEESTPEVQDIESIDFYKDTKYRPAILEREQGRCFYCRRTLIDEDSGLDHAEPQKAKGTNSYRNVVAACHSCNSSKCDDTAEGFLRKLYRRGFLGASELEERLANVARLKQGLLRPII
jgi:DNA-binding Lrp family transcriptional regulator